MLDNAKVWVEPLGTLIVARIRGIPTEEVLRECHARVLLLVRDTGQARVLYDALEMELPSIEPALIQQKLESETDSSLKLRKAIVVPNTRVAYLARLAFGAGNDRVFYNDFSSAIKWLEE